MSRFKDIKPRGLISTFNRYIILKLLSLAYSIYKIITNVIYKDIHSSEIMIQNSYHDYYQYKHSNTRSVSIHVRV